MKIHLHYGMDPAFGPFDHETVGLGGSENFATNAAAYLAVEHEVTMYNKIEKRALSAGGVEWVNAVKHFDPLEERDVLLSFRVRDVFESPLPRTKLKVIYLADTESRGLGEAIAQGRVDLAMFVGEWQAGKIMREEGISQRNALVTSNGVTLQAFDAEREQYARQHGKCVYMGTPERGLEPLLDMWPAIQERCPWAELHLYSSFLGWGMASETNAEWCKADYERIATLKSSGMKIVNHKHGNARETRKALLTAWLYLYPTRHFNETNCMCALEASAAGVPIVATARAALKERVIKGVTGYLVPQNDQHDRVFVELVAALLECHTLWAPMSAASVQMAEDYDYAYLVQEWAGRWRNEITARR